MGPTEWELIVECTDNSDAKYLVADHLRGLMPLAWGRSHT